MTLDLTGKLAAIKAEIGAVGKDQRITEGPARYAYRGIDAILSAAHQALIDHQVVIFPVTCEPTYEMRQTSKGNPLQWVSLRVAWSITSGAETLLAETVGEAMDTSDKVTNKAHTAAHKVLLSQLFAIPYSADEQDSERHELGRTEPEPVDTIDSAEYAALLARIKTLPDDVQDDLRGWVKLGPKLDRLTHPLLADANAFLDAVEAELGEPS